jgi:hypothetical protein
LQLDGQAHSWTSCSSESLGIDRNCHYSPWTTALMRRCQLEAVLASTSARNVDILDALDEFANVSYK